MNAYDSIRQFVQLLTPAELDYCRNYLTAFDSRGEKRDNKSFRLLNIMAQSGKHATSEDDAMIFLYGRKNLTAFGRLLRRLRDKLLDALTLEINVVRKPIYSEKVRLRMLMRRRLNHADALIARKQYELAEVILDGIVETAEQYEVFDELLAALRLYHQLYFKIGADESIAKIQQLIINCRRSVSLVETSHLLYLLTKSTSAKEISDRVIELRHYSKGASAAPASSKIIPVRK